MSRLQQRLSQWGRGFRLAGATLMTLTGIAYVLWPTMSSERLWGGIWPSLIWGTLMTASGIVTALGLRSRILQTEQFGALMAAVSAGMLSASQTLLMVWPEMTMTRLGGTLILYVLVAYHVARYFELGADIRSAKLAQEKLEGM